MDKVTLLSLSMDLKRIVQSIQRGSIDNADRFSLEAKRWLKESKTTNDDYLKKLLAKIEETLELKNDLKKAEDCLMYSVLIQNRALHKKN
ncbi:MAG: hypothetical protein UU34_C0008G0064 [Candidatus Curtissbacteria bacterium GW2011_GWA1_41_11]|uniref:Uncharacterized protein n=1 Tax=Candidatus Curtissbacteria bacterium GW2011_GWA1_41_11 TaxID=1618409 RepID=A0A0G0WRE5_9BACT|nr:MAG: hypothetical protein UU34_C0008G0064 [Candidatus Curtissbacteria bacterium GW2011_GWA1_41_11]